MTGYDFVMKVVFGGPSGDLPKQESSGGWATSTHRAGKALAARTLLQKRLANNSLLISTDARSAAGVQAPALDIPAMME